MKRDFRKTIIFILTFLPFFAFAEGATVISVILVVGQIAETLSLLVGGAAVFFVIYHTFNYIKTADSGKMTESRESIIHGLIGLAVMVSIWGLVNLITKTFEIEGDTGTNIGTRFSQLIESDTGNTED